MKELLTSHSIVMNPAVWILLVLVTIGLVLTQIQAAKALKFEDLRKDAKRSLVEVSIVEIVVIVIVTLAIRTHDQLMTLDESMFSIEQDLKTVKLESKTSILIGDRLDIVKDEANVVVVRSHQGAEYRIEKAYFQKKDGDK